MCSCFARSDEHPGRLLGKASHKVCYQYYEEDQDDKGLETDEDNIGLQRLIAVTFKTRQRTWM